MLCRRWTREVIAVVVQVARPSERHILGRSVSGPNCVGGRFHDICIAAAQAVVRYKFGVLIMFGTKQGLELSGGSSSNADRVGA